MSESSSLPDRLQRTVEIVGEQLRYRFAKGLAIKTGILGKRDPRRILPLGNPQCGLMIHIANFPEFVRGRSFAPGEPYDSASGGDP